MKYEAILKAIIESAEDAIFVKDQHLRYVMVNPAMAYIFGQDPDHFLGLTDRSLFPEDDARNIEEIDQLVIAGQTIAGEFIRRIKGELLTFHLIKVPLRDQHDLVVGLCGIARDISEMKKAELSLKNNYFFLQKLIDTIPSPIYYKDNNGAYLGYNNAFAKFHGISRESLIGKTVFDIAQRYWAVRYHKMDQEILQLPGPQIYEGAALHADGTLREVIFHKATFKDSQGVTAGIVGVLSDITGQRKMEQEIARLDRMSLVGEIAASLGHEIRNPLTTVRGFLQFLGQKEKFDSERELFELMIEELDRANSIITEFLNLSKNQPLNRIPTDLNNLIHSIFPLLQADAIISDKNIVLDLEALEEIPIDNREIRQLIFNLVRNGLEAMGNGGTLSIRTRMQDDGLLLLIEDQGSGIQAHIQEKIGTPFLTTKPGGTGLGLAICYNIAARHNASINFDSASTGTIFKIHFRFGDIDKTRRSIG